MKIFTGEKIAGERGSAGTTEVPVWARYAGPIGSFAENGRAVRAGGGSAVVPEGELTGKPGALVADRLKKSSLRGCVYSEV